MSTTSISTLRSASSSPVAQAARLIGHLRGEHVEELDRSP